MDNVCTFYGHWKLFMNFFYSHLVCLMAFWYNFLVLVFSQEKIGNPALEIKECLPIN
jgi:hypothetical protein